ncbi:MAG: YbjN domain-containing protein [Myxococcales bacterium]|jgi:hypothetical protein|nr:YbjN domain-containing protein [Myxococcales bacterium]
MSNSTSDSGIDKAQKVVEGVLQELGLDPEANRMKSVTAGCAWEIGKGSATVLISLLPGTASQPARLRVVSPIVRFSPPLPRALLERLLVLNASEVLGIAFGIVADGVVVLATERSVLDLSRVEVAEILARIGHYADHYDDLLVHEFGGVRVCDID